MLLGRSGRRGLWLDAPAKLLEMSQDEAPGSDLVAMDAALDLGLTDVADKTQLKKELERSAPPRNAPNARLMGTNAKKIVATAAGMTPHARRPKA